MKNSKAPKRITTNPQKDIGRKAEVTPNSKDQICDICAQNIPGPEREKIFALGKCDHHVCYVCSARLIVVCEQSECPICRKKLDNVSIVLVNIARQAHLEY